MEKQNSTRKWLITAVLLVALMQFVDFARDRFSGSDSVISKAEAAAIPTIDGTQLMQSIQAEETPTLVFIYASWCPHCRKQAPVMEQLARDHKGKLRILPISIDKEPRKLAVYLASRNGELKTQRVPESEYLNFRQALAAMGSDFAGAIPHSVLVGPDGKAIDEAAGYVDYENFKSGLDQLL